MPQTSNDIIQHYLLSTPEQHTLPAAGGNPPAGPLAEHAPVIRAGRLLLSDSRAFFVPARLQPEPFRFPGLEPESTLANALPHMLSRHAGLVIGSDTGTEDYLALLTGQLPLLHQLEVRTLYLEPLLAEVHQPALERFASGDTATVQPDILQQLMQAGGGAGSWQKLLQQARQNGIRLVALDCLARHYLLQQEYLLTAIDPQLAPDYFRQHVFNYFAQLQIRQQQRVAGSGKWLAVMSTGHACRIDQRAGVAELCAVPVLRISLHQEHRALTPHFTRLDDGMLNKEDSQQQWNWLQADLLLSDRPAPTGVELNQQLRSNANAGHPQFLLRALAGTANLELRYSSGNKVIRRLIRPGQDQGYLIENRNPIRRDILQSRFSSLTQLINHFLEQHWSVQEQGSVGAWTIKEQQQRQLLAKNFAQRRQEVLWHMSWLATPEERSHFRDGRNGFRTEQAGGSVELSDLSALGLAGADLSELQQFFSAAVSAWHEEELNARQQGALLAAIHQLQALALQETIRRWQEQISELAAQRILPITHNGYLAATDHPQGLCSALALLVAVGWMQDRDQIPLAFHLERLLQRMAAATADPAQPEARILDLALLEWTYIVDSAKFASNRSLPLHDLDAVLLQLSETTHSAAFQLSIGSHAISLGVLLSPSRRFFFADPNYGYAEFSSEDHFRLGLQLQEQHWHRLFPGAEGDRVFTTGYSLRQYRDDLPQQALFVRRASSSMPRDNLATLRLADLGKSAPLGRMFGAEIEQDPRFRALKRRLTLAEYRARMRPKAADLPLNQRLQHIFTRHSGRDNLARLRAISFVGRHALLQFQHAPTDVIQELEINGRHYPEDVEYLHQYQTFWRLLTRPLHHAEPHLEMDTLFLSSALPD
jgi:hypothetical protein